jgi:phosphatidylinositol glycan class N
MFYGENFMKKNYGAVFSWIVSCMLMSTFTLFPANKAESLSNM